MKYYIITYGCQMNKSDSERIASRLESKKYQLAPSPELADLVILNACSVRQSAVNRIYGKIKNLKKIGPKKIVLTGCLLEKDKKKFENLVDEIWPLERLDLQPKCQSNFLGYLPIMTGCNNFCTYCAVPYTRGREYSRPAGQILTAAKKLIKDDYKEIILLGQNVNSYQGQYKSKKIDFADLLKLINSLDGNFQIRFLTSHPKDMSDKLIQTVAESEKAVKEIHLPVQAGDNLILKKMNRNYTVGHYKKLVKKIRRKIPKVYLSTDIIVGFPSETKKQFNNTLKLVKEIKFDKMYLARYSPRPGTVAAKFIDDVSIKEKKRRWEALEKFNQ